MRLFARVGVGDVRMFCTGFAFGGGRLLDRVCAPVFLPLVLAYTFLSTQMALCHFEWNLTSAPMPRNAIVAA